MPTCRATALALACLVGHVAARAAADPPQPPDRLLKIELRCADERPPPALPPRAGDRVVGTAAAASGVTVATRPRPGAGDGPEPMEAIVANGQLARLRWAGPQAAWDLELDTVFVAGPAGRAARPGAEAPVVALRPVRRVQQLQLRPHWPGHALPVRVEVQLASAGEGAPLRTVVVDAPLARWTPLARVQGPETSLPGSACALQLRVQVVP